MSTKIRPFDIETRLIAADWLEIEVGGELDLATIELLRDWLEEPVVMETNLSLNLQDCDFIDCAAVAEILQARQRMQEAGRLLYVSKASPAARRIFDLIGLSTSDLLREPATAL
jgi:anti-anti-sigma factor